MFPAGIHTAIAQSETFDVTKDQVATNAISGVHTHEEVAHHLQTAANAAYAAGDKRTMHTIRAVRSLVDANWSDVWPLLAEKVKIKPQAAANGETVEHVHADEPAELLGRALAALVQVAPHLAATVEEIAAFLKQALTSDPAGATA